MALKDKNFWLVLIFILSGLVIGGLLGDIASNFSGLSWLAFGQEFGLENPLVLNLSILSITFAFMIKINIASIVGMAIAILIYKKVW
ncbi:MAG: DUF4321 domain-containing protein [Clostridia bacterium]|nr:DUF4321 domain-containing protein [Clostridia bacterium]